MLSCSNRGRWSGATTRTEISDESFFDLFRNRGDADRDVPVNRFLWQASLDMLSFLPLEGADPFSGRARHRLGQRRRHRAVPGDRLSSPTRRSTPGR